MKMSTKQAFKEIITTTSKNLNLKLPDEFVNKTIEVIILPYEEERDQIEKRNRLLIIFNESRGILPAGYKFDREESHER